MQPTFPFSAGPASVALELPGYYVWDSAVIRAEGKYHLFSSRWPESCGFGASWLYCSEIIHSVSDTPEGPYRFQSVVLPRRERRYFDGMNTHNTCIRAYGGKYYLYYMGCTYGAAVQEDADPFLQGQHFVETWNRKRIGLAVADSIDGPFRRQDMPLLEPRDCSHWDCTCTTNPAVAILPDGRTYMIYKSRRGVGCPLQLGVAMADRPEGPFRRLQEEPIFDFEDPDLHVEDPCLWYDEKRRKFCLIAKDDCKNGSYGLTGEWGSGFYAESDDCIHFELAQEPKVYSRKLQWMDGSTVQRCNLERPFVLQDEQGVPTHLFCASGTGGEPYGFYGRTDVVCIRLQRKE